MNFVNYSINNTKIIYFFLAILFLGGILSFEKLGKKEDSPFVIKTAVLITQYPGATPMEVEQLVTEPIESEIQSMSGVHEISSESYYGLSKIQVELDPKLSATSIPQKWDELRRKVLNIRQSLPSGTSEISVSDDFGDVFGIYYALTADEGFTYAELKAEAEKLKKEIITVPGVVKIALFGAQTEVVNIKINTSQLANLGLSPNIISNVIGGQNKIINAGQKQVGPYDVKIEADGTYKTLNDIRNQLIGSERGSQISLGDISTIEKDYLNPPSRLLRVNGKRAIGIGISTDTEKDVVTTGEKVQEILEYTLPLLPIGIDLVTLYPEDEIAREANNGFILNLIESVIVVVLVIMLIMGFRASLLIGSSLIFSIAGTLLIMQFMGVGLNRTSLAGFIIAMGMLVDNAIVVTDNAQVSMLKGINKKKALMDGASTPQWGLLGATFIAIISFLPLYLAPSSVAEIVKPLFVVLGISLSLSWVLALSQTTTWGIWILKEKKNKDNKDPYDTSFYKSFGKFLATLIRYRWLTISVVIFLFLGSFVVMGLMPQNFFPSMDKPFFKADMFLPDGTSIHETDRQMERLENFLMKQPEVKTVSMSIGSTPVRYYLASSAFGPKSNFANVLVELHSSDDTKNVKDRMDKFLRDSFPDILARPALFMLSPAVESTIEIAFTGENIDTLEMLTMQAMDIMKQVSQVEKVRSSWGNKIPTWQPIFSQEKGLALGLTRTDMAQTIRMGTNGVTVGEYREGDVFMPILLKTTNNDSAAFNTLSTLPVFNNQGDYVTLEQVSNHMNTVYSFGVIRRINRQRTMMAQCDPTPETNAKEAFSLVWKELQEKINIPEGYNIKYYGEAESQDQSNAALATYMPLMFILIFIILLLLFKDYKKPIVIMLMVPLIFIGVVFGLLVTGKSLDFFAMLGLLGLVGMNIKNAIVLVDQINIELTSGSESLSAVIKATQSRIVPVSMASGTTILGMVPLLFDAMFGGMAACIMGGLLIASLLTIFILPVTYATVMGIK